MRLCPGNPALVACNWPSLQRVRPFCLTKCESPIYITQLELKINQSEHNPLTVNGHIAWAAELNLNTQAIRALNPLSNTWCATGSFLGNGTLVSSGGNPAAFTGMSIFQDPLSSKFIQCILPSCYVGENGLQALRLFTPCTTGTCDIFEDPANLHLTSNRWYPSSVIFLLKGL
jgi:hypothetical protein